MATKAPPAPQPTDAHAGEGTQPGNGSAPLLPPNLDIDAVLGALDNLLQDPDAAKRLLGHTKLAGHIGGQAQLLAQRLRSQEQVTEDKESQEKRLRKMMKEAEEDPQSFAAKWLQGIKAERTQKEITDMRTTVRTEFGDRIGKAIAAIPEFKELMPEEVSWLAAQMAGKPEDEVLAVYTAAAIEKVAEKKAAKIHASWKEKELDAEVKARMKEQNARQVASQRGPGVGRPPSSGRTSDEPRMGTPEWDSWYERKYLGRRPA